MALSLLDATRDNDGDSDTLAHTPSHDLGSIAYVIGYTFLCRLVNTADCPHSLEEVFKVCFGQETVPGISAMRENHWQPLSWYYMNKSYRPHILKYMSGIICRLFAGLVKNKE